MYVQFEGSRYLYTNVSPSLHFNEILDCFEAPLKLKQAFAKLELGRDSSD